MILQNDGAKFARTICKQNEDYGSVIVLKILKLRMVIFANYITLELQRSLRRLV